jgi:hypothetical protein
MLERPKPNPRLDLFVLLTLTIWLTAIVVIRYQPYTFIFRDGSFYSQMNRSIAERFTLRQEGFQPASWYDGSLAWYREMDQAWSNLSAGPHGEWWPKHSYVMPILATPLFLIAGLPGLLVFNVIAAVVALFSGYRVACRFARPEAAAGAVLLATTAPVVHDLVYAYSHDVLCAALVALGIALLVDERASAAGVVLGVAVVAKATNAALAAPIALVLLGADKEKWKKIVVAGAIPIALYLVANTVMFGGPLATSYARIKVVHNGVPGLESVGDTFDRPFDVGMKLLLTGPDAQLQASAPIPLMLWVGLLPLLLRAPLVAVALGVGFASFFGIFAPYRWGEVRFFWPWIALAAVPGAALLQFMGEIVGALARGWKRRSLDAQAFARTLAFAGSGIGVILGTAWAHRLGLGAKSRSMAADVEKLAVKLDSTPCDYFNLTHLKWECSKIDGDGRHFTGLAVGKECEGFGDRALWLPASPRGERTIKWTPARSGTALNLSWRATGAVSFSIDGAGGRLFQAEARTGEPKTQRRIDTAISSGSPIVVTLKPSPGDAVLCFDAKVE